MTQTETVQQFTTLNRPIPFSGTREEAEANRNTHAWFWYDEGQECDRCCARSYHKAAEYPCGVEPPRETVLIPIR